MNIRPARCLAIAKAPLRPSPHKLFFQRGEPSLEPVPLPFVDRQLVQAKVTREEPPHPNDIDSVHLRNDMLGETTRLSA